MTQRERTWPLLRVDALHAVMSGIPLYTVKELLGHAASIEMTQRYAHLAVIIAVEAAAPSPFECSTPEGIRASSRG